MDDAVSARGLRRLAWLDIAGGRQVRTEGRWAYVGHMKPPHGTTIIDVVGPRNPRVAAKIGLPDDASHTHKVRAADDLMVVNVEQNDRHAKRRARRIPEVEARLGAALDRPPTEVEVAAEIRVAPGAMPKLRAPLSAPPYAKGGFRVYDIADRARPRLLTHHRTGGVGVHRFDLDDRHAYISTEMEGYVGNILAIYDLRDPARPEKISRWWTPGQHVAGG